MGGAGILDEDEEEEDDEDDDDDDDDDDVNLVGAIGVEGVLRWSEMTCVGEVLVEVVSVGLVLLLDVSEDEEVEAVVLGEGV